jgi:hypothetical protein
MGKSSAMAKADPRMSIKRFKAAAHPAPDPSLISKIAVILPQIFHDKGYKG